MVNCLLVDDEPLAREVLENYIARTPGLTLKASCPHAVDAFQKLREQAVDLLFLDVRMPLIDGPSFLRSLEHPPAVIFTTAFSDYAAESYELDAIDYLRKPFSYERFLRSIDKFKKLSAPAPDLQASKNYLYIRADHRLLKIFHHDILFIEARKDYLKIVTKKGDFLPHLTMKYILAQLPPDLFIRVHRSYIVARHAIDTAGKTFVSIGPAKIPVSDGYKSELREKLKDLP